VKEFLSDKGVSYKEIDVAADVRARNEMISKTGRMAVPTVTKGSQVVVGYNRNELEKLLS